MSDFRLYTMTDRFLLTIFSPVVLICIGAVLYASVDFTNIEHVVDPVYDFMDFMKAVGQLQKQMKSERKLKLTDTSRFQGTPELSVFQEQIERLEKKISENSNTVVKKDNQLAELKKRFTDLEEEKNALQKKLYAEDAKNEIQYPRHQNIAELMGMVKLGNQHYYFSACIQRNWSDAESFCRSHGLQLITIDNAKKQKLVLDHKKSIRLGDTWLGGTDDGHEESWVWSGTQKKLDYSNWNQGQPDNSVAKNCMQMKGDGNWYTLQCSYVQTFICEL